MFPVTLKGERVNLREFDITDAPARWAYVSDPLVSRYQSWTPLADLGACKDMLISDITEAKSEDRKVYLLAIELDGQVVGEAGINLGPARSASGSIFYTINRAVWGHGYATEAAQMILQFAFNTLKLHRVAATVNPENAPSRTVVTSKLGMRYEGRMREATRLFSDEWADQDIFGLLRRDWEEGKQSDDTRS
jgi:ribosomal-protein-alanine N-acetyltransferase